MCKRLKIGERIEMKSCALIFFMNRTQLITADYISLITVPIFQNWLKGSVKKMQINNKHCITTTEKKKK